MMAHHKPIDLESIFFINFETQRYTKVCRRWEGLHDHMRIIENLENDRFRATIEKLCMYLIPMNRRIIWQWSYVCLHTQVHIVSLVFLCICYIYICRGFHAKSNGFYSSFIAQSMSEL